MNFEAARGKMTKDIIEKSNCKIIAVPIAAKNKAIERFLGELDKFENKSKLSNILVR